jgi:hypothetical protein
VRRFCDKPYIVESHGIYVVCRRHDSDLEGEAAGAVSLMLEAAPRRGRRRRAAAALLIKLARRRHGRMRAVPYVVSGFGWHASPAAAIADVPPVAHAAPEDGLDPAQTPAAG